MRTSDGVVILGAGQRGENLIQQFCGQFVTERGPIQGQGADPLVGADQQDVIAAISSS